MRQGVLWTDVTPQKFPTVCKPKLSVPDPYRATHSRYALAWPVVRSLRCCPAATRRTVASSSAISSLMQEFLRGRQPDPEHRYQEKEYLGTLYRDGKVYCQEALKAFDHDSPSLASGVIILLCMVKISERIALLVVTSLIRASRFDLYRDNCQCQTTLLSADRRPFQRTDDLATRAGHSQV